MQLNDEKWKKQHLWIQFRYNNGAVTFPNSLKLSTVRLIYMAEIMQSDSWPETEIETLFWNVLKHIQWMRMVHNYLEILENVRFVISTLPFINLIISRQSILSRSVYFDTPQYCFDILLHTSFEVDKDTKQFYWIFLLLLSR